jgi:DNA excision repair protein ERCC-2
VKLEDFFPYNSFRSGQKDFALTVYQACTKGENLVAEAMSGFGKTATVLSGCLLAAEENNLKIIYVCRTKRQIFRVMEEISNIQKQVQLQATDLFSKYDYCLLKKSSRSISPEFFKWYCNFHVTNNLCSYFLNLALIPEEVIKLVEKSAHNFISHSALLQKSEELHICPYEVTRLKLTNTRIVVTTYHYLLEETSRSLFFAETGFIPSNTIAVFDEAHNLRDFIRNITTFTLTFEDLKKSMMEATNLYLEKVSDSLNILKEKIEYFCSKTDT